MPGNLTLDTLKAAVKRGEIDTVLVAGVANAFTHSSSSTAAGRKPIAATTFWPSTWR